MLFSILITTYDRRDLLEECVKSCLNQTFPLDSVEIIVCNDSPNQEINDLHTKIRIINHKTNVGEMSSIDEMLKESSGEYVVILADDDLMHPNCLASLHNAIESSPGALGYFPHYSHGRHTLNWQLSKPQHKRLQTVEFIDWYLSNGMREIIGVYGAINRKALLLNGGITSFRKGFSPYSDTLLPLELASKGDIVILEEKLFFLRTHDSSQSFNSSRIRAFLHCQKSFSSVIYGLEIRYNLQLQHFISLTFAEDIFTVCSRKSNRFLRYFSFFSAILYCLFLMKPRIGMPIIKQLISIVKYRFS